MDKVAVAKVHGVVPQLLRSETIGLVFRDRLGLLDESPIWLDPDGIYHLALNLEFPLGCVEGPLPIAWRIRQEASASGGADGGAQDTASTQELEPAAAV